MTQENAVYKAMIETVRQVGIPALKQSTLFIRSARKWDLKQHAKDNQ